ncbi:MAG: ADP-ribosylation factor-like protein [Promethearchaeota archaeon]
MLRLFLIFYEGEIIFIHSYAMCLSKDDLEKAKDVMQNSQVQDKTISRRILDYQIFHYRTGNSQFSLIVDLTDPIDYIKKVMKKVVDKFKSFFPDPKEFTFDSKNKNSFLKIVIEAQHELHSKISLVGPIGAGKTTLYNLLKSDEESKIMNFGKVTTVLIGELRFDLWDMQLNDNHSLLWSKIIKGSDLVIFILDASNYNLQVFKQFFGVKKRESSLSKELIIANKSDLITPEMLEKLKTGLKNDNIKILSLNDPTAKSIVIQYISDAFGLLKQLPSDFPDRIKEAECLENDNDIKTAIDKYQDIVSICSTIQDTEKELLYSNKLEKLNAKLHEIRKNVEANFRKKQQETPDSIKFSKEIQVRALPSTETSKKKINVKTTTNLTSNETKAKLKSSKLSINANDIQNNLLKIKKQEQLIQKLSTHKQRKKKRPIVINQADLKTLDDFAKAMKILLEQKGSLLSLNLAHEFVSEMKTSFGRDLDIHDLNNAVDIFVETEKEFSL